MNATSGAATQGAATSGAATLTSFDEYLRARGLSENTRRGYRNVLTQAGGPDAPTEALVEWYTGLIKKRSPIGTVQQARSALGRWLTHSGREADVAILPPARGRQQTQRVGLTEQQLSLYLQAAANEKDPVQTILLLLPRTGMRISELCQLRMTEIKNVEGICFFSFRGKGDKPRVVPLGPEGLSTLQAYIDRRAKRKNHAASPYLFPGRQDSHYKPNTVRNACARMQKDHPDLGALTPHILRHTYATRAVVKGVDLARLQALLGHGSIRTTERYLHPTVQDLNAAVTGVAGL